MTKDAMMLGGRDCNEANLYRNLCGHFCTYDVSFIWSHARISGFY